MPQLIDGILHYTKAEIDQMSTGGYMAGLSQKNAVPVVILSTDWTLQSGGDLDGWYYADALHNRTNAALAVVSHFKGADEFIHVCAGINDVQKTQSSSTVRLWLQEAPSYDLLCLVVYC